MTDAEPDRSVPLGPDAKTVLSNKLVELGENACTSADAYGKWRRRYERLNYFLGVPATVLAAVAGATAFAENVPKVLVGLCAAGAAALTGVQTVIRPDSRGKYNQAQQLTLMRIAHDASTLREIRLDSLNRDRLEVEVAALYDRYFVARSRSPE
jgi:hypothetical protein